MFGVRAAVMSNVFGEIAVEFLLLLGKVSGLIGVVAGFFLIIAPQKFFRVQSGANLWVDTDKLIRRLDRTAIDIDAVCLRHPVFFGSIGIVASTTLLVLSVVNLLHRVPM